MGIESAFAEPVQEVQSAQIAPQHVPMQAAAQSQYPPSQGYPLQMPPQMYAVPPNPYMHPAFMNAYGQQMAQFAAYQAQTQANQIQMQQAAQAQARTQEPQQ